MPLGEAGVSTASGHVRHRAIFSMQIQDMELGLLVMDR